jgi:hypothetical protein
MYSPTACFALRSTLFLLRVREHGRARDEWALLAFPTAALWTQLYSWPFVFARIVGALLFDVRDRRAPSVPRIPSAAVAASLRIARFSIHQNTPSRWQACSSEYFQLGGLFPAGAPFFGERPALTFDGPWLLGIGVTSLFVAAFRALLRGGLPASPRSTFHDVRPPSCGESGLRDEPSNPNHSSSSDVRR